MLPGIRTLDELRLLAGTRVVLRADLNVPLGTDGVSDMMRLRRLVPTMRELLGKGAALVVLSHCGRPAGRDPAFSLRPVAAALSTLLGLPVQFGDDCIGPAACAAAAALQPGEILLLENLRFHAGEEKNDPAFAAALAQLGTVLVNDAFSVCHRAHASVVALPALLPAYAGRMVEDEIAAFTKALIAPMRPVMAIVGGAKISSKLDLLRNLLRQVDVLVPGGGMANTFLAARGVMVGQSLYEPDLLPQARQIMAEAAAHGTDLLLPIDVVVAGALSNQAATATVGLEEIPPNQKIVDLGPVSIAALTTRLAQMRTVLWNGPLGIFEYVPFARGTVVVARAVAALTREGRLRSIAGGGDTGAALSLAGVMDDFSYVSAAGGAFLEWLEGKELPGITALRQQAA